jgi:hypothetical protein
MKDQLCAIGYRGLPRPRTTRWAPWPIARTALVLAFRRRAAKLAAAACGFVVLVHALTIAGQVLIGRASERTSLADGLAFSMLEYAVGQVHGTLSTFLGVQLHTTAILLGVVAGGLIAEDRRTRAFELYFSRPLSPLDYALGKGLVALLLPGITVFVPFVGLWLLAVGIAPDDLATELWQLLLPGLLGATICTVLLAATILGASALGDRGRTVGVAYVLGLVALGGFADAMAQSGHAWAGYLGPLRDVQTVADALLRGGAPGLLAATLDVRASTNDSAWISGLALAVMSLGGVAALAAQLRRQVRG